MVPKKIFQTWKNNIIPRQWRDSPISIKQMMPDWQYYLYTDEMNRKFCQQHFPDFLPYYDAFPYPIQRADAIRYMLLYVYGGLYLDLDFRMKKSVADLIAGDQICLVKSGNVECITNSFMASPPGQKLWLDVIEEMKRPAPSWAIGKHLEVMNTTGPMMLDRVVNANPDAYNVRYVPSALIVPCSVCDDYRSCAREAYLAPLAGGSWNGWDSKFFNFFLCNWKPLFTALVILLILILIILISIY